MQPESRDAAYLWDMLTTAREAHAVVEDIPLESFLENRLRLRALERMLELVGESARRVSPACQSAYPEIPWRALIGQRNLLAYEYGRINAALLYRTAAVDVPSLIMVLEHIVGSIV